VSWILLTNDDGVDSPALKPFFNALLTLGEIRVVVPASQRSWIGKALTRFEPIRVAEVEREGNHWVTVSGTPADAVQVAAGYFETPPSLVVSGINIGYNHGAGYIISSGTVGAAFEGWELGIPSVAFSTGVPGAWSTWYPLMKSPDSKPTWEGLAEISVDILRDLVATDYEADVVSVNIPWQAQSDTPRRMAPPARVTYGRMHRRQVDGTFTHNYQEDFGDVPLDGTDVGVNHAGEIAITFLMAPTSPSVPDHIRARLERNNVRRR